MCRTRASAGLARNSFGWNILRVSRLLRGFYSATMPVNQRKQGFCAQNMGGGTRNPQPGQSHEPKSLTKLLLVPIKLVLLLTRPLLVSTRLVPSLTRLLLVSTRLVPSLTRLAPSMIGLVLISVAPEAQWW
jgi:hypothetical protein